MGTLWSVIVLAFAFMAVAGYLGLAVLDVVGVNSLILAAISTIGYTQWAGNGLLIIGTPPGRQ